jgi:hypothetical protein
LWVFGGRKGDTVSGRTLLAETGRVNYFRTMSTVNEIEAAVRQLSPKELQSFRSWFQEFDADAWDRQFELDVQAGRLDALAQEAIEDVRAGRGRDL